MPGSEQDPGDGGASDDAYDVVLSFSPQDRKSVDILALELSRRGIRIFRDETPEAVAWGVRLGASIPPPQGVRSRYVIVQLEPEKARRLWGAGEAGDEALILVWREARMTVKASVCVGVVEHVGGSAQ